MVLPRWPAALVAVCALPIAVGLAWVGCATASDDPGPANGPTKDSGRVVRDGIVADPDAGSEDTSVQCTDAPASNTCGTATEIASVAVSGTSTVMGSIDPVSEHWYKVTFTGTENPSAHPHVKLTTADPSIVLDVVTDCSATAATCGQEDATAKAVKDYEIAYRPDPLAETGPDPDDAHDPGGEVGVLDANVPIKVGTSGVLYLRAYRTGAKASACDYKLDISN